MRIVVPFSAGSSTDSLARVLSDELTRLWKQTVVVENRPGIAGTNSVAKSAPDGYTLMLTSNGHTIGAVVNSNLPFDPANDFIGVTPVASVPQALIVPPNLPAKNLPELIALARAEARQDEFLLGRARQHVLSRRGNPQADRQDRHRPHPAEGRAGGGDQRDARRLATLLPQRPSGDRASRERQGARHRDRQGQADAGAAGRSDHRGVGLPEYQYDSWFGVLAPAGTPKPILDKVSADIGRVLQKPELAARLTKQGVEINVTTPDVFDAQLKDEVKRNSAMLRAAGIGKYRRPRGSACPITRLIEGERRRSARSTSSTFSCTACTVSAGSTRQWKLTISPSSVSRTRTL